MDIQQDVKVFNVTMQNVLLRQPTASFRDRRQCKTYVRDILASNGTTRRLWMTASSKKPLNFTPRLGGDSHRK